MPERKKLLAFEDPGHEGNSAAYHTGEPCHTKDCDNPAGTWWSPHWCFEHNVERIKRITSSLDDIVLERRLLKMVDEETKSLRGLVRLYRDKASEAAKINWKPLGDLKIKDRDVLLTNGFGWAAHVGRWQDARKQRQNGDLKTRDGWWVYGRYLSDSFKWYAEIPSAPSEDAL